MIKGGGKLKPDGEYGEEIEEIGVEWKKNKVVGDNAILAEKRRRTG